MTIRFKCRKRYYRDLILSSLSLPFMFANQSQVYGFRSFILIQALKTTVEKRTASSHLALALLCSFKEVIYSINNPNIYAINPVLKWLALKSRYFQVQKYCQLLTESKFDYFLYQYIFKHS